MYSKAQIRRLREERQDDDGVVYFMFPTESDPDDVDFRGFEDWWSCPGYAKAGDRAFINCKNHGFLGIVELVDDAIRSEEHPDPEAARSFYPHVCDVRFVEYLDNVVPLNSLKSIFQQYQWRNLYTNFRGHQSGCWIPPEIFWTIELTYVARARRQVKKRIQKETQKRAKRQQQQQHKEYVPGRDRGRVRGRRRSR